MKHSEMRPSFICCVLESFAVVLLMAPAIARCRAEESLTFFIIMAHCGFDTDWWVLEDWIAFYEAVKPYNLIAYFHGHSGTGVRKWKPEGEEKALDVINTGQTEKGFFVVEITPTRMRLGFHAKRDSTLLNGTEWEWRYLLDKPLVPARPVTAAPKELGDKIEFNDG